MKKILLIHGLIAGAITGGMLFLTIPMMSENFDMSMGMLIGYSTMLLALSLIFIGIKKHRDQNLSGKITFVQALLLGIGISAIAAVVYAICWEILFKSHGETFMKIMNDFQTKEIMNSGKPQGEIDIALKEIADFNVEYRQFGFRFLITIFELFPVGVLISLIAALIMKRK